MPPRGRDGRRWIASLTIDPGRLDLSAVVLAARKPDDRFFCFEQPDRDGYALAALGVAVQLEASGPAASGRPAAREQRRRIVETRTRVTRARRPAPGLSSGRLRVRARRRRGPEWSSLAPASLVLPG